MSRHFLDRYRTVAVLVLNTILLLVALNLVLYVVFLFRSPEPSGNPITARYGKDAVASAYPSLGEDEIEALLTETWGRPYAYEPFTQFKERAFHGKYVNVSEHGYRIGANQGPWPPDYQNLNIFLFGGSTTFGYGVSDDQAIGSQLQRFLEEKTGRKVRVYNFGRAHYYSSQERVLFEQLLASGRTPNVAIFIDGLNDFYYADDEPLYTPVFRRVMDGTEPGPPTFFDRLPLVRAVRKLLPKEPTLTYEDRDPAEDSSPEDLYARVIQRYAINKSSIDAIAALHGVTTVFVWQPIPTYKYDAEKHPFTDSGHGGHRHAGAGYGYFQERLKGRPLGPSFLWLADIQEGKKELLYVDRVHYTPDFSKLIAESIGALMLERRLLPTN